MGIKRLGICTIYCNRYFFDDSRLLLPSWNNGMLEYWNNGLKAHDFYVWIKGFGINSNEFPMNVLILQGGRMETQYSIIPIAERKRS